MNGGDRRRTVLLSAALVAAAVAGALCGCEDDEDDGRTVTTQVLADGSTQTVETAVFTQADGTLATQITTTVVQPDGSGYVQVGTPGGTVQIMGNPSSWSSNSPPFDPDLLGSATLTVIGGGPPAPVELMSNSTPPAGSLTLSGIDTNSGLSFGVTNQP